LIPTLTNLPVTLYQGEQAVLTRFEEKYCLSADLQANFTAQALHTFFMTREKDFIYELKDALGVCVTLLEVGQVWVILGPYVTKVWSENDVRILFKQFHFSEESWFIYKGYYESLPVVAESLVHKTAYLLSEQTQKNSLPREIKSIEDTPKPPAHEPEILEAYEDSRVVHRRYEAENELIKAISRGDANRALELFQEANFKVGLRFASKDLPNQIAMYASLRTLIRKAAEQSGLAPILVDMISQDYAVRMQHAKSETELKNLTKELVIHFCRVIYQYHHTDYSVYVKKAVQYIDLNLGKNLTAAELADFVGISQDYFVRRFCQETGMSFKQYVAQRRCDIAADLLNNSKMSIQEIAAYIGYEDRAYFTRVFKEKKGLSPQKYRATYHQKTE
jgi:AraC-like DNA-binding protein